MYHNFVGNTYHDCDLISLALVRFNESKVKNPHKKKTLEKENKMEGNQFAISIIATLWHALWPSRQYTSDTLLEMLSNINLNVYLILVHIWPKFWFTFTSIDIFLSERGRQHDSYTLSRWTVDGNGFIQSKHFTWAGIDKELC